MVPKYLYSCGVMAFCLSGISMCVVIFVNQTLLPLSVDVAFAVPKMKFIGKPGTPC